jgi:hypothetical protein
MVVEYEAHAARHQGAVRDIDRQVNLYLSPFLPRPASAPSPNTAAESIPKPIPTRRLRLKLMAFTPDPFYGPEKRRTLA